MQILISDQNFGDDARLEREVAAVVGVEVTLASCRDEDDVADDCTRGHCRRERARRRCGERSAPRTALDVFEDEPPAPDDAFRRMPGIVLTSHAAWYSQEAIADLRQKPIETALAFARGVRPAGLVDPRLAARRCLVTGGGSGIGRACARRRHAGGHHRPRRVPRERRGVVDDRALPGRRREVTA